LRKQSVFALIRAYLKKEYVIKQRGFSIVELLMIFSVAAIIIALLVTLVVRTDPNYGKGAKEVQSTSNGVAHSTPSTHKVPLAAGFKSDDTPLEPGDTVSIGNITFKYLGTDTDYSSAKPSSQRGARYVKVDFELKKDRDGDKGSSIFRLYYYPTVLPKKFNTAGGVMYGSIDYGVYDREVGNEDRIRTDPLTGNDVKTYQLEVPSGESYEKVFGARNYQIGKNYVVYKVFEVPKDDDGYISMSIDKKGYKLIP
jgi:hypothetical protein